MKTIVLLASACLLSLNMMVANINPKGALNEYCAKMKDGKIVVMYKGKQLTTDATLDNGTVVKADGTVMKKDGTKMMLKEGECMNTDGTMDKKDMKDKKKKSKEERD